MSDVFTMFVPLPPKRPLADPLFLPVSFWCQDYGYGTAIDGCHVANQPMPQGAFMALADYSIRGKLIRISPAGVLKTTGLWVEGRRIT